LFITSNVMPVIGGIAITCILMMEDLSHLPMEMRNGMHSLQVTIRVARLMRQNQIVVFMMGICIFRMGGAITRAVG